MQSDRVVIVSFSLFSDEPQAMIQPQMEPPALARVALMPRLTAGTWPSITGPTPTPAAAAASARCSPGFEILERGGNEGEL